MTVASPITAPNAQNYNWVLDTDMNSSTGASSGDYRVNFSNDLGTDYSVWVGVNNLLALAGHHFPAAEILPVQKQIPWSQVTVSGNTITVLISLLDIGNPSAFNWIATAHDTTLFDKAPNEGHMTIVMGGETSGNS
jgi:hypothetical protein